MRKLSPVIWTDILGLTFYRHMGIWPTFKSAPMPMDHDLNKEERNLAFDQWLAEHKDIIGALSVCLDEMFGDEE